MIVFEGWRYFPFAFLFLMARLEAMSYEPEEASLVDGATPWQNFWHIVFPQLLPIIALLAMLRTIWTFNEFDDIFLLTGGAAGTGVASVKIYTFLTVQRNVGTAAAQSVHDGAWCWWSCLRSICSFCGAEERRHEHLDRSARTTYSSRCARAASGSRR